MNCLLVFFCVLQSFQSFVIFFFEDALMKLSY